MKYSIILLLLFAILSVSLSACEEDEPKASSSTTTTNKQTITKPSFDKYLSSSDLASFSIRVRFKTGGDKESNLSATVYWEAYSSKPTKTPTKSDLTHVESMRQYGSAIYHNTGAKKGMTESIVYDKTHAGYSGKYIYYYVECTNSKGSAHTPVTFMVTRR